MFYDIAVEIIKLVGSSVDFLKPYATVIGIMVLLLRQNNIKKVINRRLPKHLRDTRDSDLRHIKEDVKRIMNHLGVPGWDVDGSYLIAPKESRLLNFLCKIGFPARSAMLFIHRKAIYQFTLRRMIQMKEYLKKLGSRKFQAFLIITVTNVIMLVGYMLNVADIQDKANEWMPVINLIVQAITTMVYQGIEGSIDKEAQKQQVYIVPAAADPVPPDAPELSFEEIMLQVEHVNAELNNCLKQIKAGDLTEIPKEAVQLYVDIANLIKRKKVEP